MANGGFRISPQTYRTKAFTQAKHEISSDMKQLEAQMAREMEEEQESQMFGSFLKTLIGAGLTYSGLGPVSTFVLGALGNYGTDYALDALGAGGELEAIKGKYGRLTDMEEDYRTAIDEMGTPDIEQALVDSGISSLMSVMPAIGGGDKYWENKDFDWMDLFWQGREKDRPFQGQGQSILQSFINNQLSSRRGQ